MKHLKRKLAIATSMMLIAAVMLSSVSYAWYTLSTNPVVDGMSVNLVGNANLEIALEKNTNDTEDTIDQYSQRAYKEGATAVNHGSTTGVPYTWGNVLDLSAAFTTAAPTLRPVAYDSTATADADRFYFPKYGDDGRINTFAKLVAEAQTLTRKDGDTADATSGLKFYRDAATTGTINAFSVTFWVRSNIAGDLQLSETADRAQGSNINASGDGSYIAITADASNTAEVINRFMDTLKVDFYVGSSTTPVHATIADYSTDAGGTGKAGCKLTADIADLAVGVAQEITMYVYVDGEAAMNDNALLADANNLGFNIQFKNTAITNQMNAMDAVIENPTP